ncbi:MAG TPA: methyltransferase domain-containing protein [Humisphaera sp.]
MHIVRSRGLARPAKLNLGSGDVRKPGFLNVDAWPGADVTLDLRRPLPFDSGCCDLIFTEHCLEHFGYPDEVSGLLSECVRVLRPGGQMLLSVPDSEGPLTDYANGDDAPYFRMCREHPEWHPGCTTRAEHIDFHYRQGGEHKFGYDFETMVKLLTRVGLADVRRRDYDPDLDAALRQGGSLFVAARKPV